jgi:hypothetical protein
VKVDGPLKTHGFIVALLLLTACADPMRNVERLGEVTVPSDSSVASALPGEADSADAPPVLGQLLADGSDAGTSAETPIAYVGPYTPPRRGFWAMFGAQTAPQTVADTTDSADSAASPRLSTGPDAQQVAPGTLLPYGQIATVCGQPDSALGTRVAVGSGYELYDSAANSTALRAHYITGFPDGCARIFSAALVLFGDVGTHEVVRYLPSNASMAYSLTDTAYEQVKAAFCSVPAGQPCGRNLDRLAAHTTFVTIYETFGTNPEWGEIFVHDGQVMAIDVRRG